MRTQLLGVGVGVWVEVWVWVGVGWGGVGVGLKKSKTHVPEIDAMQQYLLWLTGHWSEIRYYRHTYIDLKVSPIIQQYN